jgi:hypothetical protein
MKSALAGIQSLLDHPEPGLVFGPHERAKQPRRAHPSGHALGGPMRASERRTLLKLVGDSPKLVDLLELYEQANAADLFYVRVPESDDPIPAISFLPVREWAAATAVWKDGECSSMLEECELFRRGEWRVIAQIEDESMCLVQFFSGTFGGKQLPGRIYCLGLDGHLGFEEQVAPNLSKVISEIVRDPAAFFGRIGFTWSVASSRGDYFGDPIEAYVADVRRHPDAKPWPRTQRRRGSR